MKLIIKYVVIFFIGLLIMSGKVFAQSPKIELTPFGGYLLGGHVNFYEGKMEVGDAADYGLNMNVGIREGIMTEIYWSHCASNAHFVPYYGNDFVESQFNMNIDYIQVGAIKEVDLDKIRPFGSLTFGTTIFNPTDVNYDAVWRFSMTLGAGVKVMFSDNIGIRLHARMLMPMYFAGAGYYYGYGGSGLTMYGGSALLQGDFTGGLIFAFGGQNKY